MATRRITIDPVTRIEGDARITILLDEQGQVRQARMHVLELRGFERFVLGRPYWEVPIIVQRLCGICPVSHHLTAAKAMDVIVGARQVSPTADKVRRLMHQGQMLQNHALHFFHLASPDLLFGFDAPPAVRNVFALARQRPELARRGVMLRAFGQEILRHTYGKRIHGTGAVPGGVNKNLSLAERDSLLRLFDEVLDWSRDALRLARAYTLEHREQLENLASFPSNHLSLVRAGDGAMDLYDGVLRAVDGQGRAIFEGVRPESYLEHFAEGVQDWSYMKFPFLRALGPDDGWYRVGPLARMLTCSFIDAPEAEAARQELRGARGQSCFAMTMAYHWARMIELVQAAEQIGRLLHDPDLQGGDLLVRGERARVGVAALEAPRGTLIHRYEVDERDLVTSAHLFVPTTSNNEALNRTVRSVAEQHLSGKAEISEALLNQIEVAVRAYDPCLSCATHALGSMALLVSLVDGEGNLLAQGTRP